MPRPQEPPEYFEARRVLAQHMHRHHEGSTGQGVLSQRFEQHDELHLLCRRMGIPVSHNHTPYPEGESDVDAAQRLLKEGEDGQSNATKGS